MTEGSACRYVFGRCEKLVHHFFLHAMRVATHLYKTVHTRVQTCVYTGSTTFQAGYPPLLHHTEVQGAVCAIATCCALLCELPPQGGKSLTSKTYRIGSTW